MANEVYISAGIPPIDNSTGADSNTVYISAGLVPDDTASGSTLLPIKFNQPKRHFTSSVYRTTEYLVSDVRYGMFEAPEEVPSEDVFTPYYYKMLMQGDL